MRVIIAILLAIIAYALLTRLPPRGAAEPSAPAAASVVAVDPQPNAAAEEVTWEPITKEEVGPVLRYQGDVVYHFRGGHLLVRCTKVRGYQDWGPIGDYVLVGMPNPNQIADGVEITFLARQAGTTEASAPYIGRKRVYRLVYEAGTEKAKKPGDWRFEKFQY